MTRFPGGMIRADIQNPVAGLKPESAPDNNGDSDDDENDCGKSHADFRCQDYFSNTFLMSRLSSESCRRPYRPVPLLPDSDCSRRDQASPSVNPLHRELTEIPCGLSGWSEGHIPSSSLVVLIDHLWAPHVIATVHPYAILRIPDEQERPVEYAHFIEDLKAAKIFP